MPEVADERPGIGQLFGGWGLAQKRVNVATRQVMTSDSLQGKAPDEAATTMGAGINAGQVLQGMESDIVNEIIASIMARTFPITVVSRDEVEAKHKQMLNKPVLTPVRETRFTSVCPRLKGPQVSIGVPVTVPHSAHEP
jgi:hypothetical protein